MEHLRFYIGKWLMHTGLLVMPWWAEAKIGYRYRCSVCGQYHQSTDVCDLDRRDLMPGDISRSYKGPKNTNPTVPSWMEEAADTCIKLQPDSLRIKSASDLMKLHDDTMKMLRDH